MNCKEVLEQLQDYLDEDIKSKYVSEIEEHLHFCQSCQSEYKTLKQIGQLFRQERIKTPDEKQWRTAWLNIESQIAEPKVSLFREVMLILDTFSMKIFAPRSLALRVTFSGTLFVLGTALGALYFSPSHEILQRVVKVEHQVKEVPVVQKEYVTQETQRVVEMPKVVYLSDGHYEPAPIFPANDVKELKTESTDLWNPKKNPAPESPNIQKELEPSLSIPHSSSPNTATVYPVSAIE